MSGETSGELKWLEIMLQPKDVETKIAKLCAAKGAYHLYDEALSEAYYQACLYNDYDPGRASLSTYLVNAAKYWLLDRFKDKPKEEPVIFVDELYRYDADAEQDSRRAMMLSPSVPFDDPFERPARAPSWYKVVWVNLTDKEKKGLGYMLLCYSLHKKCTYRDLGEVLNCSHVTAGGVMKSVREKTEVAIEWTRALSALSKHWADAGTFR